VPTVRVATFNIRNGLGLDGRHLWWLRRGATLAMIEALDADVVALQEVRPAQLAWLRRRLGPAVDIRAVGRDGRGRGEHMVLVVRRDRAAVAGVEARWFTDTPTVPGRHPDARFNRCVLVATVTVEGRSVTVAGTHLDERSDVARRDAIARLAAWFPGTAVLLGDFNCTIDDPALDPLRSAGSVDALGALPPGGPGVATHHGFTGSTDGTRIDHVFLPAGSRVVDAAIVHERPPGPLPSDHWPVVATVELP
jgi:endonuclease/exonuclease/phosphatase family metal-dependent hydrolase